jgi:hypothetical protein
MIPNGTYVAHLRGTAVIYLAGKDEDAAIEGRALMGHLPMVIDEGDHAGQNIDAQICFISKAGEPQTRTTDNMKEVFGMEGANPYWIQFMNPDVASDSRERDLTGIKFNIVVEAEEYQGKTRAKVKWINPLGSSGGWVPKPADRNSVLAKYGSQFRALGGTPAPSRPPTAPPIKKAPPVPPVGPTATMEQAWEECCKNNTSNAEAVWGQQMAALFPGKTNSDLTPHEWGKLKEKFADNVPA